MSLVGLLVLLVGGGIVLEIRGAVVSDVVQIAEYEEANCTVWQRFQGASSPDQPAGNADGGADGFNDCFLECDEDCLGVDYKEADNRCDFYNADFDIQADDTSTQYRRLAGAKCPDFMYWEQDMCCNIERLYGYRGIIDAAFTVFEAANYSECRSACFTEAWQCFAFDFEDTTNWCRLYDEDYSTQVEAFEWGAFYRFGDCDKGFAPVMPSSPLGDLEGKWVEIEFKPDIPLSPEKNCAVVEVDSHTRVDTAAAAVTSSGGANLQSCVEQCLDKEGCVAVQFDGRDLPEKGVRCYTFTTAPGQGSPEDGVYIVRITDKNCPSETQTVEADDCQWVTYDNKAGIPTVGIGTDFAELSECRANCKAEFDCLAVDFTEQNKCVFYLEPAAYWLSDSSETNHYVRTECTYAPEEMSMIISEGEGHDEDSQV